MALRPLLLAMVVGIAAAGAFHTSAAQARGYVNISVGTPAPYYGGGYGGDYRDRYQGGHRAGLVWVPAHWVSTYRGRVWVHGQYVRAQGYGHDRGYGYGPRVIYRPAPIRPLPGGFYHQRGGSYPGGHHPPRGRGW